MFNKPSLMQYPVVKAFPLATVGVDDPSSITMKSYCLEEPMLVTRLVGGGTVVRNVHIEAPLSSRWPFGKEVRHSSRSRCPKKAVGVGFSGIESIVERHPPKARPPLNKRVRHGHVGAITL
ncbi:unnamed protein product [Dovyalis caffra]|uniref:Uncharacterized protein n=1 Tax=Dovyalis caffra TaxID=77055 RepID=A0AAV1R480_9ROSI|nr:unnamed protein product [Dovyalis caffra]